MPVPTINHRIDGLRVTIFDVLHYLEAGRSAEEIADILPLTAEQVAAAIHTIDENREEVMATQRTIEAHIACGNPPEIEARARAGRARMEALRQSWEGNNGREANGEGAPGRRQ